MKTIVVAGTCSGVGKTSIAVGLMAAYSRRGLRVQPFKIGSDFLDPLHHKASTGRESFNLDSWMLGRDANLACFRRCIPNTDLAIVEGVMGLYDGYDGRFEEGSTAEMAKLLCAPVLLILDCWALARSAAAMVQGYTTFDSGVKFAGVIFNKVSGPDHTAWLTEAVLSTDSKIRVLGGIPKVEGIDLERRPSGLMKEDDSNSYIKKLADLVELHVNLDAVLEEAAICEAKNDIKSTRNHIHLKNVSSSGLFSKQIRIGVACDPAFCFYYHENLALLQDAGAQLVYFSPLQDSLPSSLDAIYFGGGYLEHYLDQLSANKQLLYAVRAFAEAGGIVYGESAGLMYLSQGVEVCKSLELQTFPMCCVFPFWTRVRQSLKTGYVTATVQGNCMIFPADVGEIHGLIYHSSDIFWPDGSYIETCFKGFTIKHDQGATKVEWEGYMQQNAIASSLHLQFGSNPAVAKAFVHCCRMDRTKAAAVAAASASAVAGAGPLTAAAAGAAAATAVAAALGTSIEFKPSYGSDMDLCGQDLAYERTQYTLPSKQEGHLSLLAGESSGIQPDIAYMENFKSIEEEVLLRRTASFDLSCLRRKASTDGSRWKFSRSESEIWDKISEAGNTLEDLSILKHRNVRSKGAINDRNFLFSSHKNSFNKGKSSSIDCTESNISSSYIDKNISECRTMEECTQNIEYPYQAQRSFLSSSRGAIRWNCDKIASQESRYQFRRNCLPSYRCGGSKNVFPGKIVSLVPSATEILMDIGAGNRLLAITDSCDRPCGVQSGRHIVGRSRVDVTSVPNRKIETLGEWGPYLGFLRRKGGRLKLDVSWLSKYKPDLIVITEEIEQQGNDNSTVAAALGQAGLHPGRNIKVLTFSPRMVAEVLASIMDLGDAVGLYREACLLVELLRVRLRNVAAAVALQRRPRMLLLQGLDPLFLGGHWIPEVEMLAGGFDGLQKPGCGVELLHWQRIVSYAPEVLILAPCSLSINQTLSEVELLGRLHGFWSLPAVESGRVYICDHACFSCPGPHMVNGVELLACLLHPFVTTSISVQEAAMKLNLNYGRQCSPDDLPKHFKRCL